jgi:protein involved in polysaccharide export with SLBB domain
MAFAASGVQAQQFGVGPAAAGAAAPAVQQAAPGFGMGGARAGAEGASSLVNLNALTDAGKKGATAEAERPAADAGPRELVGRPGAVKPDPSSQFQRFVQESTGRLLPVFGSELFLGQQAYASDNSLPVPAEYVLGVGDEVRVQVWGTVDYAASHVIDRNGQISLPKVGVMTLAGVPMRDLESVLKAQLGKVFTNFSLNASLGRLRAIQVYVVGQARQPGTFQLSSLSTLINAVFASGGPNGNGSMRNIQLKRAGQTVTTIDLYDFIAKGDKGRDVPLRAGDVIVIPSVGPRVAVTGALDQAAIYELKSGATSVADILSLSGGVPALASTGRAMIERIAPALTPPRQVQDIALDSEGLKQTLSDGDVLTIFSISPAFANAVTLQGAVAAPLRYRWFEGMKILDLIPSRDALISSDYYNRKNSLVQRPKPVASGMVEQINWEYAVIERLNAQKLSTELLSFNLGRAVLQKDPAHNLTLLPGDIVTILSANDVRLPLNQQLNVVRLEGEVAAPGVYQALPGETLPQLLERAGGLTPQAYLFGAELTRQSVRSRQQDNLDVLIRRLEAQGQAQASTLVSNQSADRAAQAGAVQAQQQAQLKAQIDRLRTMKSSGRLSLELDPQARTLAALPRLPLEDGDRILIPSTPGFVAAVGSVNNENVFIHKAGKTVGDIIRTAGLTEEAEPAQAFLLRADGSIVSRRDSGGLFSFGGNFESTQVMPGDTVIVPAMMDRESRYNFVIRAAKDWTQILSNFGIGVAALKTLRN